MIIFILFFLIIGSYNAQAEEPKIYNWEVLRVIDGDTIQIANEFLPKELNLFVRMKGVDTPEKGGRAKCQKENILSQKATIFIKNAFENAKKNNQKINFSEIKWDKYGGRLIANVKVGGVDIAQELLKKGLARAYSGDKKKSWCE
jgi:micrococcal nuclease